MRKQIYEDNKYAMQDTQSLYVGCKYTLGELTEDENVPFKFRLIVERYILPEKAEDTSLESLLYYLEPKNFLCKILEQLRARIKVNVLEEESGFSAKRKELRRRYVTRTLKVGELARLTPAEKESQGMVIQELGVSKLAMMSF